MLLPLFVRSGKNVRVPIGSMPGQFQLSVDQALAEAREAAELGIGGVLLFGIPDTKDPTGSEACSEGSIVARAVNAIRSASVPILIATDVCFCEYTDHGHCGVLHTRGDNMDVENDATLELLAKQAVTHAKAGADLVAPSGMMDGMVRAIRHALDGAGYTETAIMSYAVKYASAFYGPFREAAESAPAFGDRRTYQMDPMAAAEQALREAELDVGEGSDMIMVKPAIAYLDIVQRVSKAFPGVPLAAYCVSGEYSMVKAAAERGWLDERAVALEMLGAIERAGANILITYWAKEVARWIRGSS